MNAWKFYTLLSLALLLITSSSYAQAITKAAQKNSYSYQGELYHYNDLGQVFIEKNKIKQNHFTQQAYEDYTSSKRLMHSAKRLGIAAVVMGGVGAALFFGGRQTGAIGSIIIGRLGIGTIASAASIGLVGLIKHSKGKGLQRQSIEGFNHTMDVNGFEFPKEKDNQTEISFIAKDGLGLRLTF